ncbi:Serine aminopeptidase, S33 [Sphingomonas laterariae]|uniref:Serine aminopeptidase, S33 n=1 Tax=Edaphosphingomonas laterariae TaxID=861865 RepID=A0A239K5V2_9SPHN|nr:alpha/beta fold hydrolase [Sphingomonas laterariae]SNT13495.1 Serine aminopeptidase, S33 [Sphingomonas laterariae]
MPGNLAMAFVATLVAGLAVSWFAGSIMVQGHNTNVAPARHPSEDIALFTSDGIRIAATFAPGRNDTSPAVLLLHGVDASRDALATNAAWLHSLGYATLAIDFRGHGQSSLASRTFGFTEARDARAAFEWLKRRQNDAPVAVIGISLGGAAALIGEGGPLPADALILQAVYPDIRLAIRNRIASRLTTAPAYLLEPFLSFQAPLRFGVWPDRLSPLDAVGGYRGPVLVIGGELDRSTPPAESRALFAAVNGHRELWLTPQGDHAEICQLSDTAYRARIRSFLERTMRLP